MDTLAALKQASAGTGLLSVPHRDVIAGSSPIIKHDISDLIVPVNEESDDFLVVDYKLQVALNTSIIDNLSVKAIANPNLSVAFDRISRGLQVLESWVPLSSLSGSNTVENVCERGFSFNDFTLGFPVDVGSIKIDNFQGMNITYKINRLFNHSFIHFFHYFPFMYTLYKHTHTHTKRKRSSEKKNEGI